MRRWVGIGAVLAVVWLFVRGVTPETVVGEFLIGLLVGVPIAFAFRRFFEPDLSVGASLAGAPWAAVYLAVFLRELLTANVEVAYRVLAPSMPIKPDVIELPLRVESNSAITTIANSITLTPGTLTMDYDAERNLLYVHAIDGRDRESIVAPIRTWEDYALRIFDEEREPGSPVPDPDEIESPSGDRAIEHGEDDDRGPASGGDDDGN